MMAGKNLAVHLNSKITTIQTIFKQTQYQNTSLKKVTGGYRKI